MVLRFGTLHPPLAVYGTIFILSSRPASQLPAVIPDKAAHLFVYLILGFLASRLLSRPVQWQTGILLAFTLVTLAVLDELHQLWVPTRLFSWVDIFADTVGICLGILIYLKLKPKSGTQGDTG